jgi:hypothetical protein
MLRVTPIRHREQLAEYHLHWQALAGETPGLSFSQTLDTWWALFDEPHEGEPLVLAIANDGRPLGIVPLWITQERRRRVIRGGPWPGQIAWRAVGRQSTVAMLTAWRWLKHEYHDWDQLELPAIDVPGDDRGRALNTLRQVGYEPQIEWETHGAVEVTGTWFEYWSSREREVRNAARWAEHKLVELGRVEFVRYRPLGKQMGEDESHDEWLDACAALPRTGWLPNDRGSHAVHQAAASAGALDLSLILLDDQPVAFAYATIQDGRVSVVGRGALTDFEDIDLSAMLMARLLQDSFERRDESIKFGPMDAVTRDWVTTKHSRETYRIWRRPAWKLSLHMPPWWETWTRA